MSAHAMRLTPQRREIGERALLHVLAGRFPAVEWDLTYTRQGERPRDVLTLSPALSPNDGIVLFDTLHRSTKDILYGTIALLFCSLLITSLVLQEYSTDP